MEDPLAGGSSVRPDRVMSEMAGAGDSLFAPTKGTAVDGQGMWRSWTRVFAKPESACLDLLDNCFDAALAPNFEGKVVMEECNVAGTAGSLLIQNNSQNPVKKLKAALTVYKSSKNSHLAANNNEKDSIGENGVGLKQGCATLSDCSVVFTRNQNTVEIGVIAKQLQSSRGVHLPSCSFYLEETTIPFSQQQIKKWLSKDRAIFDCLKQAFGPGDHDTDVSYTLAELVQRLFEAEWQNQDHVFLLVLCNLKKNAEVSHELIESTNPVKAFLHEIKTMLPEYYINLPPIEFL